MSVFSRTLTLTHWIYNTNNKYLCVDADETLHLWEPKNIGFYHRYSLPGKASTTILPIIIDLNKLWILRVKHATLFSSISFNFHFSLSSRKRKFGNRKIISWYKKKYNSFILAAFWIFFDYFSPSSEASSKKLSNPKLPFEELRGETTSLDWREGEWK